MDARLVLFEREGGSLPQHHHAQRLHPDLSLRIGAIQYSCLLDTGLSHEPQAVPPGQTNLLPKNGQL